MKNSNDPLIQAMIYQTSRDYVRELDASSKKKRRILTIDVPAEEEQLSFDYLLHRDKELVWENLMKQKN